MPPAAWPCDFWHAASVARTNAATIPRTAGESEACTCNSCENCWCAGPGRQSRGAGTQIGGIPASGEVYLHTRMYVKYNLAEFFVTNGRLRRCDGQRRRRGGRRIMVRRTKEEALETRNRILDTAEQVFVKKGGSNTALAQLAEAAGGPPGAG